MSPPGIGSRSSIWLGLFLLVWTTACSGGSGAGPRILPAEPAGTALREGLTVPVGSELVGLYEAPVSDASGGVAQWVALLRVVSPDPISVWDSMADQAASLGFPIPHSRSACVAYAGGAEIYTITADLTPKYLRCASVLGTTQADDGTPRGISAALTWDERGSTITVRFLTLAQPGGPLPRELPALSDRGPLPRPHPRLPAPTQANVRRSFDPLGIGGTCAADATEHHLPKIALPPNVDAVEISRAGSGFAILRTKRPRAVLDNLRRQLGATPADRIELGGATVLHASAELHDFCELWISTDDADVLMLVD